MSPHGAARVALPALPSVPDDGLVLWLMGDVGVYTDGSGQVVWWQDQSGRGGDVTQPTFAFRPTFVTSRFNGLPAVRFDGIDDYLTAQGIVATDAFTLFVIAAASTSIRIDSPGSGGTAGMTGQHYLLGVDNPGGDNSGACISLGTNGAAAYDYGNAYLPALAVYSAPIGTSCPLVIRYTSKTPTIYLCGAEVASGLTSPMSNVYPPNRIGGSDYGTFAGDIAEILIYNRAVDDTERAAVESYLQAKYACRPAPSPTPTATPRPTPTPTPTPHHTPRPTPYPTPTPTPILPPPPPTPTITPTPTPTPTPIPTPTPTAPPPPPTATPQPSGSPSPSGSPEPSPTPEPCVFDQSHHIGYGVSDTQIYASAAYITINRKGLLCGEATGATADAFSAAWASVGADGPAGTVWAQVGIIRKRINGAITYNVYTEVKTGPRDPQDHILHYNFPAPAVGTQVQFRCSLDVGTGVWYFYRSDLDPRHPFDHIDPVPGGYWQKGVTGTSASYAGEGRNHQDKVPGSVSKHCLFGGCCYWRTSEVNPIPGAVSPIDDIWEGYKSTPASEKKDFEIWDTRNP